MGFLSTRVCLGAFWDNGGRRTVLTSKPFPPAFTSVKVALRNRVRKVPRLAVAQLEFDGEVWRGRRRLFFLHLLLLLLYLRLQPLRIRLLRRRTFWFESAVGLRLWLGLRLNFRQQLRLPRRRASGHVGASLALRAAVLRSLGLPRSLAPAAVLRSLGLPRSLALCVGWLLRPLQRFAARACVLGALLQATPQRIIAKIC